VSDGAADSPGVRFPPPFLYAVAAAFAWWVDTRWPWRPAPGAVENAAELAGAALAVAGLAFDLGSLALFWRAGTSPLPFRGSTAFVARGPYRFTRNPMYLGMTLFVAGLGGVTGRLVLVPAALLSALLIDRFVIPREERHLEHRFGDSYRDYKRRVRRWL
jgi:protein-S-isoprenylcysteine O-methyltransferase Ste14